MKFRKSKEYPKGAIICTTADADKLVAKGWTVNMHVPGYTNFIGYQTKSGLSIGFGGYMSNLGFDLETPEVGYYGDAWAGGPDIDSKKKLTAAIKLVDAFISLDK